MGWQHAELSIQGWKQVLVGLLLGLSLLACGLVDAPSEQAPPPQRPPVVATVLARQTATAVSAHATPVPSSPYHLLVANRGSADLTRIDPVAGTVVNRIAVGEQPWDVVVTPDGRHAYVSHRGGVTQIDLSGPRVTHTIDTAFHAQGLALTPDGRILYIGSRSGQTVAAVNLATGVLTTLPSGEWHFGLTVSPDGRWVLAPGHYTRSLSVIDAREQRIVTELTIDPLGAGAFNLPHYAVVSPDSRYAYLPFQGRSLVRITLGTWTVEHFPLAIDAHQHGITISPDGSRLYVINVSQHESLSEIDTTTFRELRRLAVPGAHERVILSPDGQTAFLSGGYSLGGHDNLTMIDLASGQVTTMASGGSAPVGLALVHGKI